MNWNEFLSVANEVSSQAVAFLSIVGLVLTVLPRSFRRMYAEMLGSSAAEKLRLDFWSLIELRAELSLSQTGYVAALFGRYTIVITGLLIISNIIANSSSALREADLISIRDASSLLLIVGGFAALLLALMNAIYVLLISRKIMELAEARN